MVACLMNKPNPLYGLWIPFLILFDPLFDPFFDPLFDPFRHVSARNYTVVWLSIRSTMQMLSLH